MWVDGGSSVGVATTCGTVGVCKRPAVPSRAARCEWNRTGEKDERGEPKSSSVLSFHRRKDVDVLDRTFNGNNRSS